MGDILLRQTDRSTEPFDGHGVQTELVQRVRLAEGLVTDVRRASHGLDFITVLARWRSPAQAVPREDATAGAVVVELEGNFARAVVVALHFDQEERLVFGGEAGVQQVISCFWNVRGLQGWVGSFGSFFQRGGHNFLLVGLLGQVRVQVLHVMCGHMLRSKFAKTVGVVAEMADDFEGTHLLVHQTRGGALRTLADTGPGHVDEVPGRVRDAVARLVGSKLGVQRALFLQGGVVVKGPAAMQVEVLEQFRIGERGAVELEPIQFLDALLPRHTGLEPE